MAATPHPIRSHPTRCAECRRRTRNPFWSFINTRRQRPYCADCSRAAADQQWMRYFQLQLPLGGAQ